MDERLQDFLDKSKEVAVSAAQAAGRLADSASKKAGQLYETTKINLQIFDTNTDIELLYKEIGKKLYAAHNGTDVSEQELYVLYTAIDEKNEKLKKLREALNEKKTTVKCSNCGKECAKEDAFCKICGHQL